MLLNSLSLQNFRSYKKASFSFSPYLTIIIGPNTAGKTNLLEAISLLSYGKSFREEQDAALIHDKKTIGRVKAEIASSDDSKQLEIIFSQKNEEEGVVDEALFSKKFLVNKIPRRRSDFISHLKSVIFVPTDLDIVISSPSHRRNFLDDTLEMIDRDYRIALFTYTKALRQRNALLHKARETGIRNEKLFSYWDNLLITNASVISQKRGEFIDFINDSEKEFFPFLLTYDKSILSMERLKKYEDAEIASGVTLVGPHRDNFLISFTRGAVEGKEIRSYGSRGQQRLVVLQLKLLQRSYISNTSGEKPLLLLDDIFSELDSEHIDHVLSLLPQQQVVMTTTHEEFVNKKIRSKATIISLGGKV